MDTETNTDYKAVRIVNLNENTSSKDLKQFILQEVPLEENIVHIHIRRDYNMNLTYSYIIFENSSDAQRTVLKLNGFYQGSNQLDVAGIGPNLQYKTYYPTLTRTVTPFIQRLRRHQEPLHNMFRNRPPIRPDEAAAPLDHPVLLPWQRHEERHAQIMKTRQELQMKIDANLKRNGNLA